MACMPRTRHVIKIKLISYRLKCCYHYSILVILFPVFITLCTDPRVKDWLWMQSPIPTISLILLYLLFVRYAPRFMKDRPAFEMKIFLFFFNTAIVILYIYLTREVSQACNLNNNRHIRTPKNCL